jgi:four helix bundle protein
MDKPHKRLEAWKLSMDLAKRCYKHTEKFPANEQYGLVSQIRRAAVSIPANLAEGAARQSRKESVNHLHIARGSLSELDTLLELAMELGYLLHEEHAPLDGDMIKIDRMLNGLIRRQRFLLGKE